jgi:hypothetical protein
MATAFKLRYVRYILCTLIRDSSMRPSAMAPPGHTCRKLCLGCNKHWTRQTIHRHLVLGCTRCEQDASHRKALGNIPAPSRQHNLPLRLRSISPPSPRPSPISRPPPHTHGQGPGRRCQFLHSDDAHPDEPNSASDSDARSRDWDARLRNPDFAHDTPGAGPSNRRPQAPMQHHDANKDSSDEGSHSFEDEWAKDVFLDSDSDDGRPDGLILANEAPWLEGLSHERVVSHFNSFFMLQRLAHYPSPLAIQF